MSFTTNVSTWYNQQDTSVQIMLLLGMVVLLVLLSLCITYYLRWKDAQKESRSMSRHQRYAESDRSPQPQPFLPSSTIIPSSSRPSVLMESPSVLTESRPSVLTESPLSVLTEEEQLLRTFTPTPVTYLYRLSPPVQMKLLQLLEKNTSFFPVQYINMYMNMDRDLDSVVQSIQHHIQYPVDKTSLLHDRSVAIRLRSRYSRMSPVKEPDHSQVVTFLTLFLEDWRSQFGS